MLERINFKFRFQKLILRSMGICVSNSVLPVPSRTVQNPTNKSIKTDPLEIGKIYCLPTVDIFHRPGLITGVSGTSVEHTEETDYKISGMQMVRLISFNDTLRDEHVTVELLPRIIYSELHKSVRASGHSITQPDEIAKCSGNMLRNILYASLSPKNIKTRTENAENRKSDPINNPLFDRQVEIHSHLVPRVMGTSCDLLIKTKWWSCQIVWVTPVYMLLLCLSRSVLLQVPTLTSLVSLRNKWITNSTVHDTSSRVEFSRHSQFQFDGKEQLSQVKHVSECDQNYVDDHVREYPSGREKSSQSKCSSDAKYHYKFKEYVWDDGNFFSGDIRNIMRVDISPLETEMKTENDVKNSRKSFTRIPGQLFIDTDF